jgi:Leucine-rich repeat (LRR) protein
MGYVYYFMRNELRILPENISNLINPEKLELKKNKLKIIPEKAIQQLKK